MKLYEYEAKKIFKEHNIPVPKGETASTPEDAERAATEVGFPVVLKSQVLVGGRGKAGGIKFATSPEEAHNISSQLLTLNIKGEDVKKLLIEEKITSKQELYIGFTVDRAERKLVALASNAGGMDIEEVAATRPEAIIRHSIDPFLDLRSFDARAIAAQLQFHGAGQQALTKIILDLYSAGVDYDAELVEINPLILTDKGSFVAADARLLVDDNSLFRHPQVASLLQQRTGEFSAREIEASELGFSYVELDGDVGIVGNGAGLVMATLDLVKFYGGNPANFLDIGGGAGADVMEEAVGLLLQNPKVKVIFVNILGGITDCADVARGLVAAFKKGSQSKPVVVRLTGNNQEEGRRILTEAKISSVETMEEAAKQAVELVKGLEAET